MQQMNDTLELPEWEDIDWESWMKNIRSSPSSPAQPTSSKRYKDRKLSSTVTSSPDSDQDWLEHQLKNLKHGNIENSDLDRYLEEESRNVSRPPRYGDFKHDREVIEPPATKASRELSQSHYNHPPLRSSQKENHNPAKVQQENILKSVVLEFRSLFLSSSEQLKIISKFFANMKEYLLQEAEMDTKAVDSLLSSSFPTNPPQFQIPFRKLQERYPKIVPMDEIILFDESYQGLNRSIVDSIQQIGRSFDLKKANYLQQLKKLKEVSNNAIRNSIQSEKAETVQTLHRLKGFYEQQWQAEKKKLDDRYNQLLTEKRVIEDDYLRVKMHLEELLEKSKVSSQYQQEAVRQALREQKQDHQLELTQLKEMMSQEYDRLKQDFQQQLQSIQRSQETSVNELRTSEREKREIVEKAKVSLEQECDILRKENAQYAAQLSSQRDQFRRQMEELRERHIREIQERTANELQSQAMVKNDLAATLQRIQKEEQRRKQELEDQFQKMRNELITAHALELEKAQDRHRAELKRVQAEQEAQHQESLYKLKHLHEQELNRQIRENDRLQRLLARQGVATAMIAESGNFSLPKPPTTTTTSNNNNSTARQQYQPPSRFSFSSLSSKPVYTSLTPQRKLQNPPEDHATTTTSQTTTTTALGLSSAPATTSTNNNTTTPATSNTNPTTSQKKLSWGALENSLKAQEERDVPRFSRSHLPPDPFPLDEAMAASKQYSSTAGLGITSNAQRVTSYLHQLEDYLQGKEIRVDQEIAKISDENERRNYLLSSLEEELSESDSLDDSSIDLQQLAQRPLEISGQPSDTSHSSTSDLLPQNTTTSTDSSSDLNLSQFLSSR